MQARKSMRRLATMIHVLATVLLIPLGLLQTHFIKIDVQCQAGWIGALQRVEDDVVSVAAPGGPAAPVVRIDGTNTIRMVNSGTNAVYFDVFRVYDTKPQSCPQMNQHYNDELQVAGNCARHVEAKQVDEDAVAKLPTR